MGSYFSTPSNQIILDIANFYRDNLIQIYQLTHHSKLDKAPTERAFTYDCYFLNQGSIIKKSQDTPDFVLFINKLSDGCNNFHYEIISKHDLSSLEKELNYKVKIKTLTDPDQKFTMFLGYIAYFYGDEIVFVTFNDQHYLLDNLRITRVLGYEFAYLEYATKRITITKDVGYLVGGKDTKNLRDFLRNKYEYHNKYPNYEESCQFII